MTIDTTKLRELAMSATPGPWTATNRSDWSECVAEISDWHVVPTLQQSELSNMDVDAAYISAANPATMLALLDELTRTQGSVAIASAALSAAEREVQRLRTIEAAARNLAKVKGRHHSEQAYQQLERVLK